jgi:C4-dicarboxylate-specific signal transduction histidine kinase
MALDRSTLWQREEDQPGLALTHFWQRPGLPALLPRFQPEENCPWVHQKVVRGETFQFTRWSDLPPEASREADLFRRLGSRSLVCIPLMATERSFGALAFTTVRTERKWLPDEITELKLVAQIIANVIGRRRAEERAEQLREEIAHSARTSMLGELAAALAHELNQPLTAILSNAQAGRRFIADGTLEPEEMGAILDDIVRDGRRAGSVVHNLRAMLSNASPPRDICCLNEVIHEMAEFMHSELVSQDIELRLVLEPSLPQVRAARVEMQQVLVNLLMNAVQAMGDAPAAHRRIDITTQAAKTKVTVKVRDHGRGLPPKEAASIFQPFFTTKSGGLGMGLSICRRVIEAHEGFIAACTHEEGGAVFAFSLPAIETSEDHLRG